MHMVFREIKITAAVVSIVLCLSAFQEKYKTRSSFFLGFILLHSFPPFLSLFLQLCCPFSFTLS